MGLAALGCFASAIIVFGIAVVWWQHNHDFVQSAERVEGEVIEIVENRKDGNRLTAPIIEFTDHLGQQQKFQSSVFSSPQRYFVGDKVQVLYDKDNPRTAVIDSGWEINLLPLVLFVGGILNIFLAIILALIAFFVYRHRPRNVALT